MRKSKIIQELFASNKPFTVLANLKFLDYENSSKKIKQSLGYPLAKKILFHDASKPNSYSELRSSRQLGYSNNLEGELAWFVNSILKFSIEINNFIAFEKKFENLVLMDKDLEAKELIQLVNSEICYSYWAMENLFSIEDRLKGTEDNWTLLKNVNGNLEVFYSLFFSGFYSKKAEKDTTIWQYKRELENILKGMEKNDVEYILFKLAYFFSKDFSAYPYFLYAENLSSIIDKYLFLIEVLFELSTVDEHISLVEKVLLELSKNNIIDNRLSRIAEFNELKPIDDFNPQIVELFDIYSYGKYQESSDLAKQLIQSEPNNIEVYEIYLKSLMELDKGFVKTGISTSVDNILMNLYSIFDRNEDYYTARENLLKLYLCHPKVNFFKQILSLVSNLTSIDSDKDIINRSSYIFSNYSNPSLVTLYNITNKLKFKENDLRNHICLRINEAIANSDFSKITEGEIPAIKLDLYMLRANYYQHDEKNLSSLISLNAKNDFNNYFKEEIILFLYSAYLKEDKADKAISVFVNAYFKNKFFVERLKKISVLNYSISNNCDIGEISIDIPIYYYLEDANSYYQYTALDVFLDSISLTKPSEVEISKVKEVKKLIYLLRFICTTDVLNNFYLVFETDSEVIEERQKILRLLATLDDENSDTYFEEIATLTQKLKIKEIIDTVNDGKINLNFSRIKEDKEYDLENSFNRFIRFKEFSVNHEMNLIDISELVNSYLSELKSDSSKLQKASFVSFKTLFFEIVDYFLFSKEHGLDGDLSTRIRHGVLENQLRSVFINKNLIATKNKNDEYNDIEYWKELCDENSYPLDISKKLQKALKKFSKTIDDYIQSIINDYIQIQSNRHTENKKGLFNYRFTDEYLWIVYKEVTDKMISYDYFLNSTFDILKVHTENILKGISEEFKSNLNGHFQNSLMSLEDDITKALELKDEIHSELKQNIYTTTTLIQNELYNIAEWFKISNNLSSSFLDIETIIQTAIESININSYNIRPNVIVDSEHFFEAGFYYIDIFKILLENAIKHSGLATAKLKINIEASTSIIYNIPDLNNIPTSLLIVKVKNNLSDEIDTNGLKKNLETLIENWNTELGTVNQEGGSGFQKIRRILKYDIKALDSSLNYTLTADELTFDLRVINNIQEFDEN
ncbi:hypothetical protein ACNR9Q_12915 [Maribacter sp. X9]|uniref:hypothetical protein n=1 Tax=Maribacter sp. X9 TaxID=3402159 RepID=UPI003AF3378B